MIVRTRIYARARIHMQIEGEKILSTRLPGEMLSCVFGCCCAE